MKVLNHPLSERKAEAILTALPECRRETYLQIARESGITTEVERLTAAQLYVWNGYLASVVDRLTGEVEVLLRNWLDKCLTEWNSHPDRGGSPNWIEYPEGVLGQIINPEGGTALKDRAHLGTVKGDPTHDDYVAGLTFGQWLHILPKPHAHSEENDRLKLWGEALEPLLPDPSTDRVSFQRNAKIAKDMRNRATHRRPLIKDLNEGLRSLNGVHKSCIELAKAINPEIGAWIQKERWIPDAIKQNPLK
ncbi:hypothetical protein [Corynebacterium lizhenjunii]|uniref:hypothetical protein n=1 Tax=Corynebacterium lizhenjunii TaxID=2709394 RepID=UPI001F3D4896|nr:hypothetical protein [Corynebacterium lizhenjunii]